MSLLLFVIIITYYWHHLINVVITDIVIIILTLLLLSFNIIKPFQYHLFYHPPSFDIIVKHQHHQGHLRHHRWELLQLRHIQ